MIQFSVKPNTRNLELLADGFREAPGIMKTVWERNARRVVNRKMAVLKKAPKPRQYPADYPIDWETEKQRRAFWASNGFGRGIPTRPTGTHVKAWKHKFRISDTGCNVEVYNKLNTATFLFGARQQRMHKGRYADAQQVFTELNDALNVVAEESWRTASDPRAGVQ